jgi:hypothetical protein
MREEATPAEGHCFGWSLVAAALPQPQQTIKRDILFYPDEMEGLYSELGDAASGWGQWIMINIPASPVSTTQGEPIDGYAGTFQTVLASFLRKDHQIMNADLRSEVQGDELSIWNHDIYKYSSTMVEAPGGNELIIDITTQITANVDFEGLTPPSDNASRNETYHYILEYWGRDAGAGNAGRIRVPSQNQNWIACSHYPPKALGIVTGNIYSIYMPTGAHCSITREKVDALYQ